MGSRRHQTQSVKVGNITVGGNAPVVVQSMTNTDTADIGATVRQVAELARAGSELVRLTVNNDAAAKAIPHIRDMLAAQGCYVPLVGDFHFNGHTLLMNHPACAEALAKYRINPGNVGKGAKRDSQFATLIEMACRYDKPIRIGVNWGSLDGELMSKMMDDNAAMPEPLPNTEVMHRAMIESALSSAERAEQLGLGADHIILSCKMSAVQGLISVYRMLAAQSHYALHLGLTEAGMGSKGIVASTAGLAVLLQEGIGDTIRVSLTPAPGEARTREVQVVQEILQSLELRSFTPTVTSCPGCGRTSSDSFQHLAEDIQDYLREQMPEWRKKFPGVENMQVAVMGCIVNGPGESKHANIGISLPGSGENVAAPVFVEGERVAVLKGANIAQDFKRMVDDYIISRYGTEKSEAV